MNRVYAQRIWAAASWDALLSTQGKWVSTEGWFLSIQPSGNVWLSLPAKETMKYLLWGTSPPLGTSLLGAQFSGW